MDKDLQEAVMSKMTVFLFAAALVGISMPMAVLAFGGSGGGTGGSGGYSGGGGSGGCCGIQMIWEKTSLPSSIIAKISKSYGVAPNLTESEMKTLSARSLDDLQMLLHSPVEACKAAGTCSTFGEKFFRFLLNQAIKRKEDAQARARAELAKHESDRTYLLSMLSFCLSIASLLIVALGAALELFKYVDQRRREKLEKPSQDDALTMR